MTPLERHCGWLLRAYPAWYRRERAGEMLGTLLDASRPGRRWPSFRDARVLVIEGLRARGSAFFLTILWAGLGAAGAGYDFIASMHVSEIPTYARIPCWVGEPGMIIDAGYLGGAAWLLFSIPVLAAGMTRLRRTDWAGLWPIAWIAGFLLMIPIATWETSAPAVMSGNCWAGSGCILAGYRYAVVSWGELAVLTGWLALGASMTLTLARTGPPRARRVPDKTVTDA
jgi:hypothetical protein